MSVRRFIVASVALVFVAPVLADTIQLEDGRSFSGSMRRDGDTAIITTDDGRTVRVNADKVAHVSLTGAIPPAEAAQADWVAAVAAINRASDLQTILALHDAFLKKYPDQPVSTTARTSLANYQKLQQEGAVKFAGQWMPADQAVALQNAWAQASQPALDAYKAQRYADALAAANAALKSDGRNPDALLIEALSAYHNQNFNASRQAFASLIAAAPDNVVALNNYGVICTALKQPAQGFENYDRALQLDPKNRLLVDNISNALSLYTGDLVASPYQNLLSHYKPAEAALELTMSKQGLVRWGCSWANQQQAQALSAALQQRQQDLATVNGQCSNALSAIAGDESNINNLQEQYTLDSINGDWSDANNADSQITSFENDEASQRAIVGQAKRRAVHLQAVIARICGWPDVQYMMEPGVAAPPAMMPDPPAVWDTQAVSP